MFENILNPFRNLFMPSSPFPPSMRGRKKGAGSRTQRARRGHADEQHLLGNKLARRAFRGTITIRSGRRGMLPGGISK